MPRARICSAISSRRRIRSSVRPREALPVRLLGGDEPVRAVQGKAPVVADDAAAGVVVRQAGDDAALAQQLVLVGVGVEDAVVVGLAIVAAEIDHRRREFMARLAARLLHHPPAAERLDGALERCIGLQADDALQVAVDVTGAVTGDGRDGRGVDVEHPTAAALLRQQRAAPLPQRPGRGRRAGEKAAVATGVGCGGAGRRRIS